MTNDDDDDKNDDDDDDNDDDDDETIAANRARPSRLSTAVLSIERWPQGVEPVSRDSF